MEAASVPLSVPVPAAAVAAGPIPGPVVRLRRVCRRHVAGGREFVALDDLSLDVAAGECVAVVGRSGSGKTTLVNLVTGIDAPSAGELHVAGRALHRMSQDELAAWRGRHVGLVFQFFQLLPTLTVAENVMLPMDFLGAWPAARRVARMRALLARLGIADQADKLPAELSGGQQQRAAIARALANDPPLLVADEPTGNLDSATARDVLALLAELAREGRTVLVVTHERETGHFFSRTLALRDGRLESDTRPADAAPPVPAAEAA